MSAYTHDLAADGHGHGHDDDEPHVLPLGVYLAVWGTLVVLTGITVFVAHFDFGAWNTVVAMVVATIKASLVALYFMHLRYDNKLNLVVLLGSLMLVSIFFYPVLTDLTSRGYTDSTRAKEINLPAPPSALPAGVNAHGGGAAHHE